MSHRVDSMRLKEYEDVPSSDSQHLVAVKLCSKMLKVCIGLPAWPRFRSLATVEFAFVDLQLVDVSE